MHQSAPSKGDLASNYAARTPDGLTYAYKYRQEERRA